MASVRRRKGRGGVWMADYFDGRGTRHVKTFASEKAANIWLYGPDGQHAQETALEVREIRKRRRDGSIRKAWRAVFFDRDGKSQTKEFGLKYQAEAWTGIEPAAPPERPEPRNHDVTIEPVAVETELKQELAEIKKLLKVERRNEYESGPAILRRITEIERLLKATELHVPPRTSRRNPMGAT
jgi:hypothetical protein